MNSGIVTQVLGPVVDVHFDDGDLPPIYTALTVTNATIDDQENNLVLEIVQHIGDRTVRAIAMDATEGLSRGLVVQNTGKGIEVPVGPETLGRIINVVGSRSMALVHWRRKSITRSIAPHPVSIA